MLVCTRLCLIGGFRYRLLNASARVSADIDYHWEGDLQRKQAEIVDVLRSKLLPEVKRQLGYDGDIRPATGPEAESPAVRIVETAFYRVAEPGSRVEIPIEITRVARLDSPLVRTIAGTVFLTVSDADMIESKILAFLNARFAGCATSWTFSSSRTPCGPTPRAIVAKTEDTRAAACGGHRDARPIRNESGRPRAGDSSGCSTSRLPPW